MRRRVKAALNGGYRWMESNPVTVMLVALGLGGFATAAVVGVALRGESTRDIITRSACGSDAGSDACQKVKRESDREQSVSDACIPIEKVDRNGRLLRLTRCQGTGTRKVSKTAPTPSGSSGETTTAPVPTGSAGAPDNPQDSGGDGPTNGGKGGSPKHPHPAPETTSPAPAPTASTSPAVPSNPVLPSQGQGAPAEELGRLPSTVEVVGDTAAG
jgi:hypothetical protein